MAITGGCSSAEERGCSVQGLSFQVHTNDTPSVDAESILEIDAPGSLPHGRFFGLQKEVPKRPLHMDLFEEGPHHGRMRIRNHTGMNVVSWRLFCNHDVTLMPLDASTSCLHPENLPRLGSELVHPQSSLCLLKNGAGLEFCFTSNQDLHGSDPIACSVNTVPVDITMHTDLKARGLHSFVSGGTSARHELFFTKSRSHQLCR